MTVLYSSKSTYQNILKNKLNFNLSKRAFQVIIEPFEPAVNSAVQEINKIDSNLLKNVKKIIVHSSGGSGQLGHVESGPGKDPQEIHIFKDRIKEHVLRNAGNPQVKDTLTKQELEKAIINGIIETIAHESGHIGPRKTPEEASLGNFFGEGEAEAEAKRVMQSIHMSDDDDGEKELNKAIKYNEQVIYLPGVAKYLYIFDIDNFDKKDFVLKIFQWQKQNDLEPTGKLDYNTIKLLQEIPSKEFPKNFGVVIQDKVYRGSMPKTEEELLKLKNIGIQRIVALHSNPDLERMCNKCGLKYEPAYLENGRENDLGRQLFKNSVYDYLTMVPTYVCCYFGQDRTGGVIARLRTESGWPCDLAYAEAKAYGFKDIFVDLIDWFSEPCDKKIINTDEIRKLLNKDPYQNPEVLPETQDAKDEFSLVSAPAPDDLAYSGSLGYTSLISMPCPIGISSVPIGAFGFLSKREKIASCEENSEEQDSEKNGEEDCQESDDLLALLNGTTDEYVSNMFQGYTLEPFYSKIS